MPRPRRPQWLPAVTFAIAGSLLALAVATWIAWQPAGSPIVVVDVPATMASPPADAAGDPAAELAARDETDDGFAGKAAPAAAGNGTIAKRSGAGAGSAGDDSEQQLAAEAGRQHAGLEAAISADRGRGGPFEEPPAAAAEDIAEEPFIEVPLVVTRGSNLRNRPTVNSIRLMWVARGSAALLLDPEAVGGYYKVSTGEREGWIWHANVEPADVTPTDDEQSGDAPAGGTEAPAVAPYEAANDAARDASAPGQPTGPTADGEPR